MLKKNIVFALFFVSSLSGLFAEPVTCISRFNKCKYPTDFTAFSYVKTDAPKGGRLKMGTMGTFDSLNRDIVKGIPAESLIMTLDSLMKPAVDDPHALYPLIAEKVDVASDFSQATFYINPKARFHDGTSITAEDVDFTFKILCEKGLPRYRHYFSKIETATVINSHTIRLDLKKDKDGFDRELPMILARAKILSKEFFKDKDFQSTGLTPILGSGPYRVGKVVPGRSIEYVRVKDYWASDLPVNKGQYNFDKIIIDYYTNAQAQFEAFKAGEFDCFFEADQKQWQTAYNFKAVQDGRIKQISARHRRPVSVRTLIFNLRRPLFQDIRVRKALTWAYDFETFNKMYCYDSYDRMTSLFANTLFVSNTPPLGQELDFLRKFKDQLPPETFTEAFHLPKTTGDGNQRHYLQQADQWLTEAGWVIDKNTGKRVHKETGQPLVIEFMMKDFRLEKVILAYKKSLSILGINLNVRMVDTTQYEKRAVEKDFDMIAHTWTNSLSPGIEQTHYFSAEAADAPGSSNYIGVKDPMYSALAGYIANAQTEEELIAAVRALDRAVMQTYLMVPVFYDSGVYFSYWQDRLDYPPFDSGVGTNVLEWWWAKKIT